MQPPKSTVVRLLLGAGTHLPLVGVALLLYTLFGRPEDEFISGSAAGAWWFNVTWVCLFFGSILAGGIAVYYLFIVYRSEASESDRQFWLYLFFMILPVAGPIFWYRVIWKRQSISVATKKA